MALKIQVQDEPNCTRLCLIGPLDEEADLTSVKLDSSTRKIQIDLAGLQSINSFGGRAWSRWIKTFKNSPVELLNCTPVFLEYVNLLDGFLPDNGTIQSFKIPYFCPNCDLISTLDFISSNLKFGAKEIPEMAPCQKCGNPAEIDVLAPSFFKFLEHRP